LISSSRNQRILGWFLLRSRCYCLWCSKTSSRVRYAWVVWNWPIIYWAKSTVKLVLRGWWHVHHVKNEPKPFSPILNVVRFAVECIALFRYASFSICTSDKDSAYHRLSHFRAFWICSNSRSARSVHRQSHAKEFSLLFLGVILGQNLKDWWILWSIFCSNVYQVSWLALLIVFFLINSAKYS
jgi:hypothetical protein